jgi:hypothetical protein
VLSRSSSGKGPGQREYRRIVQERSSLQFLFDWCSPVPPLARVLAKENIEESYKKGHLCSFDEDLLHLLDGCSPVPPLTRVLVKENIEESYKKGHLCSSYLKRLGHEIKFKIFDNSRGFFISQMFL